MESYQIDNEWFFPVDLNKAQFAALRLYFSGEMDVFDFPLSDQEIIRHRQNFLPLADEGVRVAVGRGGPDGRNALLVNGIYLHSDGEFATFPESKMPVDPEGKIEILNDEWIWLDEQISKASREVKAAQKGTVEEEDAMWRLQALAERQHAVGQRIEEIGNAVAK